MDIPPDQTLLTQLREALYAHFQWEAMQHRPATPAFVPVSTAASLTLGRRSDGSGAQKLQLLAEEVAQCQRCRLSERRTQTVFSRGMPSAEVAFVGEGPGYHEDQEGKPFVGAAGKLLDRMIQAMRYHPNDVYICNVVKCRPPENRTPLPDEVATCLPYLEQQLRLVSPRVIVALGKCASQALQPEGTSMRGWRGTWSKWHGIDVMSTYHPAFLLRSPEQKKITWEDLKQVMQKLGNP